MRQTKVGLDCDHPLRSFGRGGTESEWRNYSQLRKVGEGSYSVVYHAVERYHHALNPPSSSSDKHVERHLALKALKPNQDAVRVRDEVKALRELTGSDHVVNLIDVVTEGGFVVLVMPYFQHADFSASLASGHFDAVHTCCYMCGLLRALKHIHGRGFIHRDIKPSNVLYNFAHRRTMVVDFGLVQRVVAPAETGPCKRREPLTTLAAAEAAPSSPHATPTSRDATPAVPAADGSPPSAAATAGLSGRASASQPGRAPLPDAPPLRPRKRQHVASGDQARARRAALGGASAGLKEAANGRMAMLANLPHRTEELELRKKVGKREGTPGFRAPEVLLKSANQTHALDIWSSGVIMMCLLLRRHPLFHAPSDEAALHEILLLIELLGADDRASAAWESHVELSSMRVAVRGARAAPVRARALEVAERRGRLAARLAESGKGARELLLNCLSLEPGARGSAAELLTRPYFEAASCE